MADAKRLALITYGCQMNKHDSERIAGILEVRGFRLTEDLSEADLIILNTCSIREKAEQKFFSELGRLKTLKGKNRRLKIGVGGCIGQREGEGLFQRASHADLVFGTQNLSDLPRLVDKIYEEDRRVAEVRDDSDFEGDLLPARRESPVSAWVSIMKGCDNFCTYCVVPYTRGRERSKPSGRVIEEIEELSERGYKEVTLLGQNVNSYGNDIPGEMSFPQLLARVNDIKGIERIRFVTSHPKDLSPELMDAISGLPKVCEHLHLPVQSGSDRILERMKRGYTSEEYLAKLERLRESVPGMAFTTDIMVGFPGETDEDFADTRELMMRADYDGAFLFKYSVRPGTEIASCGDPVPAGVKDERFNELNRLQTETALRKNRRLEGSALEVLVGGVSKRDKGRYTGRTRSSKIVHFSDPAGDDPVGELVNVKIKKGGSHFLEGELVNCNAGRGRTC